MLSDTKEILQLIKSYGFMYGLITIVTSISFKLFPESQFNHKLNFIKYRMVSNYIEQNYKDLIEKYKSKEKNKAKRLKQSKIIWLFWWQGEDKAPQIVKACIKNIKKNAGNNKVILIDKSNYQHYAHIPNFIVLQVQNNSISVTHFSDILRFCLLSEHGGAWIDSTVFVNDDLSKITNYPFYTVKHGLFSKWHVCRGLWSTFFIESFAENPGILLIRDILIEYAKTNKNWMAYLFTDAVIGVVYDNIPSFKLLVDSVPFNNAKVFDMFKDLNLNISLFNIPSSINKLSYKFDVEKFNNNSNSVYHYLINDELK